MIILRIPKPTLFIAKGVNSVTNEKHVTDEFPGGSVKFVLEDGGGADVFGAGFGILILFAAGFLFWIE